MKTSSYFTLQLELAEQHEELITCLRMVKKIFFEGRISYL
jgi:hypothetical protein